MSSNPIELSSLIPQGGDSSEVSCLPWSSTLILRKLRQRALCGHTFFADKAIGGFFSDFGFAWGSLKSMAALSRRGNYETINT